MISIGKILSTRLFGGVNKEPPSQCVACLARHRGVGLCRDCLQDLPVNTIACSRCALPLPFALEAPLTCGECQADPPAFTSTIAPWQYRFPVDRLISRYKDQGQRALGLPLARQLGVHLQARFRDTAAQPPDLLVPAPMHPARQRQRGFNQAEEIAEHLSGILGIPYSLNHLRRTRTVPSQRGLNRRQRLANLAQSIEVHGTVPAHVAIIDDVITTGATARMLASHLQRAGADRIEVWALARTPG